MQRFLDELAHQAPYLADWIPSGERKIIVLACLENVAEVFDNASANAGPSVILLEAPDNVEALIVFIGAQYSDEACVSSSSTPMNVHNSASPNNTHNNADVSLTLDNTDTDSDASVVTSSSGY